MSSQPQQQPAKDGYEDVVLDHNYDGIEEYDNPMPGWWKAIFVVSVVWAGIYTVGINLGYMPTYGEDLRVGQAEIAELRYQDELKRPKPKVDAVLLASVVQDDKRLTRGSEVYARNCANCHGNVGQGLIGPNLTDDRWLHGGSRMAVYRTIVAGTKNGMPAWAPILSYDETLDVVAYIHSLRGTNPPKPKAPEGKPYDPSEDELPSEEGASREVPSPEGEHAALPR